MGRVEDDETNTRKGSNSDSIIKSGSSDSDTQNFNPNSPSELEDMNLEEFQSTIPFTDTFPIENETQELKDMECDENAGTQVLLFDEYENQVSRDSDGEGTDRTEVLSDADGVESINKSERGLGDEPIGEDLVVDSNDETCGSGSIRRGFTSVRRITAKGTKTDFSYVPSNSQSGKDQVHEDNKRFGVRDPVSTGTKVWEDDQEHNTMNYNGRMHDFRDETRCRSGTSTARKLFTDDIPGNKNGSKNGNDGINGVKDFPESPTCNHEFRGLRYLGSQEPGEFSQADALNVVDRFISVNDMELSQEAGPVKTVKGKSTHVSTAKRPQSLVQMAKLRSIGGKSEIFDWVDSQEDEGGGDFFSKRKEVLFGSNDHGRVSFTQPPKPRQRNFRKGKCLVDKFGKEKEGINVHQKIMSLTHSDSKLMSYNVKDDGKIQKISESKTRKNLFEELDEQMNPEVIGTSKESLEIYDVGIDTQMAAEAMEALLSCSPDNHIAPEGCTKRVTKKKAQSKHISTPKRVSSGSGSISRLSKRSKVIDTKLIRETRARSLKHSKNPKLKESGPNSAIKTRGKKGTSKTENSGRRSSKSFKEKKTLSAIDKAHIKEVDYKAFTPVALRTRRSLAVNPLQRSVEILGEKRRRSSGLGVDAPEQLTVRSKNFKVGSDQIDDVKLNKPSQQEPTDLGGTHDEIATTSNDKRGVRCYPRERTCRTRSDYLNDASSFDAPSIVVDGEEVNVSSITRPKRTKVDARSTAVNLDFKRKTRSMNPHPSSSLENKSKRSFTMHDVVEPGLTKTSTPSGKECDANSSSSAESSEGNAKLEESPRVNAKPSGSACVTPINCSTPISVASPVCVGNDYHKQLFDKRPSGSSLRRELIRLDATPTVPASPLKDLRKKRDMANVRVLFSRHLDDDIIKQQKKILARLGASVACSSSEATHFVTDKFVRTRNMLEAIAFGKPVVTHLWLKSCGQVSCFIDEKNYILRDSKKEKEIGFSMPISLARSCQSPLLQGKRVFITPNVKPGKEVIVSLVKAVQGQAVERIGRSVTKDDKVPDDLLVLSCEEDYAICVPLLEKGAIVYSSELILNGIVIQKLEYDRHSLFTDHVKRTRSTIWLRKDGDQFHPVIKRFTNQWRPRNDDLRQRRSPMAIISPN